MTYSSYEDLSDVSKEDDERFLAEQAQLNEMEAATEAKYAAMEQKEFEEQEAAIANGTEQGPTLKPTEGEAKAQPKQQEQQTQQKPTEQSSGQKQVPGWGADPKPEDRWNIRDRAPARAELQG